MAAKQGTLKKKVSATPVAKENARLPRASLSATNGNILDTPTPETGELVSRSLKRGRDLVVGDIIRILSRFERVVAIEDYVGVNRYLDGPEPARIARFPNGEGMTIFPNDWCEMEA